MYALKITSSLTAKIAGKWMVVNRFDGDGTRLVLDDGDRLEDRKSTCHQCNNLTELVEFDTWLSRRYAPYAPPMLLVSLVMLYDLIKLAVEAREMTDPNHAIVSSTARLVVELFGDVPEHSQPLQPNVAAHAVGICGVHEQSH